MTSHLKVQAVLFQAFQRSLLLTASGMSLAQREENEEYE
jgi:hypothetical protein